MNLNHLKYVKSGTLEMKSWSFQSPNSHHRNLIFLGADGDTVKDLFRALQYGLTGRRNKSIEKVQIELSDDAGDTWTINRDKNEAQFFRAGKPIRDNVEDTLLASLLDLDAFDNTEELGFDQVVKAYNLKEEFGKLQATDLAAKSDQPTQVRSFAIRKMESLTRECAKIFKEPAFIDRKVTQSLVRNAEPIYIRNRELSKQAQTLAQQAGKLARLEPEMIDQLEQEIELMQRVSDVALPLLDPSENPALLREKLEKVESQLKALCQKCQITTISAQHTEIDWMECLQVLSKMYALEHLIAASEASVTRAQKSVKPVYANYVKCVKRLLDNDSTITSELESCLTTLTLQNQEPEPKSKTTLLSRLTQNGTARPVDKRELLEKSRMAIDYALGRLGELHSSLGKAKNQYESALNQILDQHERIVKDYGQLKKRWQTLAEKNCLPEKYALKDLLVLVMNYGKISLLWNERALYRDKLKNYKSQLSQLGRLIGDYRQTVGSQKDTPLDAGPILLSEARGIIQYLQKKRKQLKRLKQVQDDLRVYANLRQYIEARRQLTKVEWKQALSELSLPYVSLTETGWEKVFACGRQVEVLSEVLKQSEKPLTEREIFSKEAFSAPLSVFIWDHPNSDNATRIKFLQLVEKADTNGLGVLLVNDPVLADMLFNLGISTVKRAQPRGIGASVEPTSQAAPSKPLLSNKAQAALNLLQVKKTAAGERKT